MLAAGYIEECLVVLLFLGTDLHENSDKCFKMRRMQMVILGKWSAMMIKGHIT